MDEQFSRAETPHVVIDKKMKAALKAHQKTTPTVGLTDLFDLFNATEDAKADAAKQPSEDNTSQAARCEESSPYFLLAAYPPIDKYSLPVYGAFSAIGLSICIVGMLCGW